MTKPEGSSPGAPRSPLPRIVEGAFRALATIDAFAVAREVRRDALVAVVLHATFLLYLEGRDANRAIADDARGRATSVLGAVGLEEKTGARLLGRAVDMLRAGWARGQPEVEELGASYEALVDLEIADAPAGIGVVEGPARRRAGAHYTSLAVATHVVALALEPLLRDTPPPDEVLALRICDPAMGSGIFLLAATRALARSLERAGEPPARARRRVIERCLHGVDRDPFAALAARMTLELEALDDEGESLVDLRARLRHGDALRGAAPGVLDELVLPDAAPPLAWTIVFPDVFARGGFDAIVGNPPWVSYAGRAAQPLDAATRAHFLATSPAFHGYRNLQGVFVHRAATLLRPGGRLGLVLPTSMSDLAGYEPSRRAHDELCVCDASLPDLAGGGFEGVFQPCMALLSTRRTSVQVVDPGAPWPLARGDLDPEAARALERLDALPKLPAHLFGERGFQTSRADVMQLSKTPHGTCIHPIRVGGDVGPFLRREASLFCDPAVFGDRFRSPASWREVRILLRQTARYPMAALADGAAFRNSVLAGFADDDHPAPLLLAYLGSSAVRFYHFMRHRDARQGMPQLKIGHLRALPAPPRTPSLAKLAELGAMLGARNTGVRPAEQAMLDDLVSNALGLDPEARARIAAWAATQRVPKARGRAQPR